MIALDTNVLIYACDRADSRRQQIAIDLIANSSDGVLLWQVACEFVAASRKLSTQGFTASDAWSRLTEFLALFPLVLPTPGVLERGQSLHSTHGVSFWDALILAASAEAGVEILYSEDVPGIATLGALRVVNPFK
ncbi:MAG TPA: PIN domain-containing protein [Terriglobia bacterium]|nr:PIN domain-containing protein [Terriglobia bacterium]